MQGHAYCHETGCGRLLGCSDGHNPKSLAGVISAAAAPAGAVWSVHAGRCPGGGVYAAYGCEDGLVCTLEAAVPRDTRLQQPAPTAACGGAPHLWTLLCMGTVGPQTHACNPFKAVKLRRHLHKTLSVRQQDASLVWSAEAAHVWGTRRVVLPILTMCGELLQGGTRRAQGWCSWTIAPWRSPPLPRRCLSSSRR